MSRFLQKEVALFRARNVIHKVKAFKFFPRDMTTSIIEKSKILVFLNNDAVSQVGIKTIANIFTLFAENFFFSPVL